MKQHGFLKIIKERDCAVLGYGVSNRPLVEWLVDHGAKSVTVRDQRSPEDMEKSGDTPRLQALGAHLVCGEGYLKDLTEGIIFRSPGIRPHLPEIQAAVAAGAILSSEMELFLSLTEARVIAISGSDGKTTTTTVTSLILEEACKRRGTGKVYRGGNIGTPLLPFAEDMTPEDFAVVEQSSFQLMTMGEGAGVTRGALTNITPNHLNWHTDMAEYITAKTHLLGGEIPPEAAVLNGRDENTRRIGETLTTPVTWFTGARDLPRGYLPDTVNPARGDTAVYEREGSIMIAVPTENGVTETPVLDVSRIRVPGRHNVENFMTAIALTRGYAEPADVGAVADSFLGVPHRLELVREIPRAGGAIRFYNSSIDSSPTRTLAALSAMTEMNTREGRRAPTVICGGQDKHVPFDPLAEGLCRHASRVIITGEARDQILTALRGCPDFDPAKLPVTVIPDYREAMRTACETAADGDTVLLSPACTSFDAFKNFAERGEVFRATVNAL